MCGQKACPLCRMRGSSTCSELPPRTLSTTEGENSLEAGEASLRPKCGWEVRSRATSPSPSPRRELFQESMQKQFGRYFQTALAREDHLPALHSGVECISCDLGDGRMTKVGNTYQTSLQQAVNSEMSLFAFSLPFSNTPGDEPERAFRVAGEQASSRACGEAPFRDAGAATVPREDGQG